MNIMVSKKIIKNPALIDSLILVFFFLLSVLIVNPLGDFPLNDDWAFAVTVNRMVEIGMYVPTGWSAMTLFTNIAWGALFTFPFGFSFNVLRASTLIASLAGILGVYFCAKELGLSRLYRVIAALVLAFNPIYFALSYTFMTDVLFTSLQVISALFFLRFLRRKTFLNLILGTAVALAATMSRQLGIAIPLAFAFSYILLNGISFKSIAQGFLPFLICAGVLVWYQHWLSATGRMPPLYSHQNARVLELLQNPRKLMLSEAINGYKALLYFGLFLVPAMPLFVAAIWQKSLIKNVSIWSSVILVAASTYIYSQYLGAVRLPMLGNILGRMGIGPLTLRDTFILGASVPELPYRFWSIMTWLALFGAILIVFALIQFLKELVPAVLNRKLSERVVVVLFFWLSTIIYLSVIFTTELSDRYLLPVVPLLTLAVLSVTPVGKGKFILLFRSSALILSMAFAVFAMFTTQDYLSLNRTRWQALNDLTKIQNVSAGDIDGGFEFNGFYLYDRSYRARNNKSWWWVDRDLYLISLHEMPGFSVVSEYPFVHRLPQYEGKILVLRKND